MKKKGSFNTKQRTDISFDDFSTQIKEAILKGTNEPLENFEHPELKHYYANGTSVNTTINDILERNGYFSE